jgi:NADH:ubiquinone oxidoreductase subunit D
MHKAICLREMNSWYSTMTTTSCRHAYTGQYIRVNEYCLAVKTLLQLEVSVSS